VANVLPVGPIPGLNSAEWCQNDQRATGRAARQLVALMQLI